MCTRLQVAFMFLIWPLSGDRQPSYMYKDFQSVEAFSHKFSIAGGREITDQIWRSYRDAKNGTDFLCHRAQFGGIVHCTPAVD